MKRKSSSLSHSTHPPKRRPSVTGCLGTWVSFQGEEAGNVSTHICLTFYHVHKRDHIQPLSLALLSRNASWSSSWEVSACGCRHAGSLSPGLDTRGVSLLCLLTLTACCVQLPSCLYASMLDAFAGPPCKKACAILHLSRQCWGTLISSQLPQQKHHQTFFFFFASLVETHDDKHVVFQFVFFNVHLITSEIECLSMNRLFVFSALFFSNWLVIFLPSL